MRFSRLNVYCRITPKLQRSIPQHSRVISARRTPARITRHRCAERSLQWHAMRMTRSACTRCAQNKPLRSVPFGTSRSEAASHMAS
eukprot:363362-Chlamydomonas_euryale.AAC.11